MASTLHWTSADLEGLPDDGKRYEVIDGELFVSKQPHFYHQQVCSEILKLLAIWSDRSGLGRAIFTPGLIFANDDDVAPDVAMSGWPRRWEKTASSTRRLNSLWKCSRPAPLIDAATAKPNSTSILAEASSNTGSLIGLLAKLRCTAVRMLISV